MEATATRRKRRITDAFNALIFVLPALIIYIFIIAYPTISGFYYSLTNWSGSSPTIDFIGLRNYIRLFRDEVFYIAIRNTVFITLVTIIVQNIVALFLGNSLNASGFPGRAGFRALFFIPSLLTIIVVGYTWLNILSVHLGVVGYILKIFNINNIMDYDVFLKTPTALLTICFVFVWQYSGYTMVIYLSGLQSIPDELYESCHIDGANTRQKFFGITLPLLMPSITISVFLNLTSGLKAFEHIYVLTRGGPGYSTETIGTFIYNTAFVGYQLGYGTAISTVLFVSIIIVSTVQLKVFRSHEVEL